MATRGGTVVSYEWSPDPVVEQMAIFSVAEALRDPALPLMLAKERTQEDIVQHFQMESDPSGFPWEDWAESYAPRAQEFPNIGILRRTDELYEQATSDRAFIISNDAVFYDASVIPERGIWHQEGRPLRMTRGGAPNPLPKREFLGLSPETETYIMAAFVDWFDNAVDLYVTSRGRLAPRHALRSPVTGRFIPR